MKKIKINEIPEIVDVLKNDGIIAFPTDTVYGLGCKYDSEIAINKIKKAKGRDENKPLPMMVSKKEMISEVAIVSDVAIKLMNKFMPGAITLVFEKKPNIESYITNGFNTIAIRIPDHEESLKILKAINCPMLVTSANKSDTPSKFNSTDVIEDIGEYLDLIIEGESLNSQASTIVDVTNGIKILRHGLISEEEIMEEIKK